MIVLLTGQPCSGKTTIAKGIIESLCEYHDKGFHLGSINGSSKSFIHLDGDDLRKHFKDEDYSVGGRIANIDRALSIATYLEHLGHTPIMSMIFPYKFQRERLKQTNKVAEIYCYYDAVNDSRSRVEYWVQGYEAPENDFLGINTTMLTVTESISSAIDYMKCVDNETFIKRWQD